MKIIGFFAICFLLSARLFAQSSFSEGVVWPLGVDAAIKEHFVYGLAVAKNRTLLAFSEGRIELGDSRAHHIVLKRSKDYGKSWLQSQILVKSTHGESFVNPTPIVDPKNGKIFLFYARNHSNKNSEVFYITSKNHGVKWSKPRTITRLFDNDPLKRPFHLPGPGHGIVLQGGRLLMQLWHRYSIDFPVAQRRYGVSVIYSDNSGKTWNSGGYVSPYDSTMPANESRLVQLPDGKVMIDCRFGPQAGELKRIQSFSSDEGISWSAPQLGSLPGFTAVDAGLNKLTTKAKTYLVFTRPLGPDRNNLGASYSEDDGRTWSSAKLIYPGPANYCDIAILPDNSIFVLYGRGKPRYAAWARFDIGWLTDQK